MRKLLLIGLFLFCLAFSALALVSTKEDGVIMYSGPGVHYKMVMDMPKFYPLKITSKAGDWYKVVDWMNTKGWVKTADVSNKQTAVVRKIRVNLRSGPGTGYRQITRLYKGYILRVVKRHGNWYNVIVVDPPEWKKGWVYRGLLWG